VILIASPCACFFAKIRINKLLFENKKTASEHFPWRFLLFFEAFSARAGETYSGSLRFQAHPQREHAAA